MRREESKRGSICVYGRGEQSIELGDQGCVASVGRTECEIQFAGLLEFASKEEDRFWCWGGSGDRELDVLSKLLGT